MLFVQILFVMLTAKLLGSTLGARLMVSEVDDLHPRCLTVYRVGGDDQSSIEFETPSVAGYQRYSSVLSWQDHPLSCIDQ